MPVHGHRLELVPHPLLPEQLAVGLTGVDVIPKVVVPLEAGEGVEVVEHIGGSRNHLGVRYFESLEFTVNR